MSTAYLTLLYSEYALFVAISFTAVMCVRDAGEPWRLKPSLLLIVAFAMYTSAMPISRILGLSSTMDGDVEFMAAHLLAISGMAAGAYLGRQARPGHYRVNWEVAPWVPKWIAIVALLVTALFTWRLLYFVGYDPRNLLERYRFEDESVQSTGSMLDKVAVECVAAVCAFGVLVLNGQNPYQYSRRIVIGCLCLVTLLLLVRGNRNPTMLLVLPVIGVMYWNRALPIGRILFILVAMYPILQTIAIVRNVGIAHREAVDIRAAYYDPMRSELGTSYNVWTAAKTTPFFEQRVWGKTYTWDTLINLLPSIVWEDKPKTPAGKLSFYYYELGGDEVFGLGFSPVLEAYLNFGWLGLAPFFCLLVAVLRRLEGFLERRMAWGRCCWAALLPLVVNLQRIDFAVAFKLFVVYLTLFVGLDRVFMRGVVARRERGRSFPVGATARGTRRRGTWR